jgi:tryptophan 7-halogenase
MKRRITVVGGGTAGLVAAITIAERCKDVDVAVVRSTEIGTIMVGEGTFAETPNLLHEAMGIPREALYREVNPVWKLGVRLRW